MPELMQFLLSGVTVGAVYALVALGFTIIYNASDVVNFAQGEFVMLGGMGNPIGALVGGLLLGLIEALTAGYVSSVYKDAAAFIVILLVLFFMPRGIFGTSSTDRV